jgi:hypothetical protein
MSTAPPSTARSARGAQAGAYCRRPRLPPRRGTEQAPSRAQGHPGGDTREAQRRHRCTCLGRRARPLLLFSPPGYGLSTLEARWKLLL